MKEIKKYKMLCMILAFFILASCNKNALPSEESMSINETTTSTNEPILTNETLVTNEETFDTSIEIPIKEIKLTDAVNVSSDLSFEVLLCTDLLETEKTIYNTLNPTKAIDLESVKAKIFIDNKEIEILGKGNTYRQGEKIVAFIGEKSINVSLKSEFEYDTAVRFEESLLVAYQYIGELVGYEYIKNIGLDSYVPKLMTISDKEEIVGYNFLFSNEYKGIQISASIENNFFRVFTDSNGVAEIAIKWDYFEEVEEQEILLTNSSDALKLVVEDMKQYEDYYSVIEPIKIIDVHLSYSMNMSDNGLYRLVWEFCLEDLPSIYVDVNNLEIYNPLNPA